MSYKDTYEQESVSKATMVAMMEMKRRGWVSLGFSEEKAKTVAVYIICGFQNGNLFYGYHFYRKAFYELRYFAKVKRFYLKEMPFHEFVNLRYVKWQIEGLASRTLKKVNPKFEQKYHYSLKEVNEDVEKLSQKKQKRYNLLYERVKRRFFAHHTKKRHIHYYDSKKRVLDSFAEINSLVERAGRRRAWRSYLDRFPGVYDRWTKDAPKERMSYDPVDFESIM